MILRRVESSYLLFLIFEDERKEQIENVSAGMAVVYFSSYFSILKSFRHIKRGLYWSTSEMRLYIQTNNAFSNSFSNSISLSAL